jgi:hypothetical protein
VGLRARKARRGGMAPTSERMARRSRIAQYLHAPNRLPHARWIMCSAAAGSEEVQPQPRHFQRWIIAGKPRGAFTRAFGYRSIVRLWPSAWLDLFVFFWLHLAFRPVATMITYAELCARAFFHRSPAQRARFASGALQPLRYGCPWSSLSRASSGHGRPSWTCVFCYVRFLLRGNGLFPKCQRMCCTSSRSRSVSACTSSYDSRHQWLADGLLMRTSMRECLDASTHASTRRHGRNVSLSLWLLSDIGSDSLGNTLSV